MLGGVIGDRKCIVCQASFCIVCAPLQTASSIHLFPPLQRDLTRTEPPSLRVRVDPSPFPSVRVSSFCPEFGLLAVSFQQVVAASLFTLFRIVVLADSGSATA